MSDESKNINSEITDPADEELLQRLGSQLREQREHLDAPTLSKLNQARQRALEELDGKTSRSWFGSALLPVGVAAALMLAVAGVAPLVFEAGLQSDGQPAATQAGVEATEPAADIPDLDMMFADESLELMEEIDFYLWLEDEQSTADQRYSDKILG